MSDKTNDKDEDRPEEKAAVTLSGTVEKIIPPITPQRAGESANLRGRRGTPLQRNPRREYSSG
jgi:hypothetical protein